MTKQNSKTQVQAPSIQTTSEQRETWFNEIGKIAGKARTSLKQALEKKQRIEQGIDKKELADELRSLLDGNAPKEAHRDMIFVSRELQNADEILSTAQERHDEFMQRYNDCMTMLSMIVENTEFERNTLLDPDKFIQDNFPTVVSEESSDEETESDDEVKAEGDTDGGEK